MVVFFFQAEDGIRDDLVTGVQTCALPISLADAYELYAFLARHISETRIAIESCIPFTGDVRLMALQLAHCRECSAPRLTPSHQLRSQFVCDECTPAKARRKP